jgi:hypothetical protein
MPNIQVKLRRGTAAEHDTTNGGFTGAEGEVTVDTTNDTLRVHDGSTTGGHELAKASDTYTHPNHTGDVTSTGDGATIIANDAVTNSKIANDAVTNSKLANDSVTNSKIANDAVTNAKIADGAVTVDKVDFPTTVAHARFFGNVGTGTLAQEIAAGTVTWVYGFSAIVSTATAGLYTLTFSSARPSGDSYTVVLGREFTSPTTDSIVVRNRTANGFDLHCSHTASLSTVGLNVVVIG